MIFTGFILTNPFRLKPQIQNMTKRKVGRPPVDPHIAKSKNRFEFTFSTEQVEAMGGRSEVLKFVKESITKECVNRAQEKNQ